jgi:acyl dehydratase
LTETQLQFQYFEDLTLGGEWTTRRRTVTESDLSLFSGLVGDFSPLTVDAEHAAASHFGGRVASGPFLVATAMGLGSIDTPLPQSAGLVGMTWRFLKPARAGDTLHTVWRLARKRPVENPTWGLAVWQVAIRNQQGETLADGEVARLIARREGPPPPPASRRRRRRRSGAVKEVQETPPPEPAPADTPSPSRRRRRRSSPEQPEQPAAETAGPPAPSRRRRRRRSNGQRNGNPPADGGAPPADSGAPPAQPADSPGNDAPSPAQTADFPGIRTSQSRPEGLGGVFRRIRRRT